jgi:hypothetical protein
MGHYDVQQVCLNGHQTTDRYNSSPQFRQKHCDKCGAATIHQCPKCEHPIKGDYQSETVIAIGDTTPVPTHCENCGEPYPWTKSKELIGEAATAPDPPNAILLVETICNRFHLVAKQLCDRHGDRATLSVGDEYDVQDLMHALLRLHFDDIRPEEWTPSYAGSCSRIDFLLKDEKIVIEVKKTRPTLKAKHVGEQLLVDIQRYKVHQDCKTLVCFVYDPDGWISNPRGLENDLNREEDGFLVKVLIVPRGY